MFPSSSPRIKHPENHDAEVDLHVVLSNKTCNFEAGCWMIEDGGTKKKSTIDKTKLEDNEFS